MEKRDIADPSETPRDGKRLSRQGRALLKQAQRPSFRCVHCRMDVPTQAAGTHNRNHCPYCLWSRHVDETVGDRKSSCLAAMRPLGLALKTDGGELMVVNACTRCSKISKNRIAGDDLSTVLVDLLMESRTLDSSTQARLAAQSLELCQDAAHIREQIFGKRVR